MKFVLIFYIFAIILVCNAGSLQRITRSEHVQSDVNVSTERNQINNTETSEK